MPDLVGEELAGVTDLGFGIGKMTGAPVAETCDLARSPLVTRRVGVVAPTADRGVVGADDELREGFTELAGGFVTTLPYAEGGLCRPAALSDGMGRESVAV